MAILAHRYSSSMVPWCPGRQRKRKAMGTFPSFTLIKSSLATKSIIGRLIEGEDSLTEHARHTDMKVLPVVAPRTSSFKSRTIRSSCDPNLLTDLVLGTLMQYPDISTMEGPEDAEISSLTWMSRRCLMGFSSRASGQANFMSTRALKFTSMYCPSHVRQDSPRRDPRATRTVLTRDRVRVLDIRKTT